LHKKLKPKLDVLTTLQKIMATDNTDKQYIYALESKIESLNETLINREYMRKCFENEVIADFSRLSEHVKKFVESVGRMRGAKGKKLTIAQKNFDDSYTKLRESIGTSRNGTNKKIQYYLNWFKTP
jgi:hypothetical protein